MPSKSIAPTASFEAPPSASAGTSVSTGTAIERPRENGNPIKYSCGICNKIHNCRKSMRHCSHPNEDTELSDIMSHKKRKKDSDALYHKYMSNVHKRRQRGFT